MKDILSAFQYRDRGTSLNRLDPRSKLIMIFSIILFIWIRNDLIVLALGLVPIGILVAVGRLLGDLRGTLKVYLLIGVVLLPLNAVLHSIYSPVVEVGGSTILLSLTAEGTPLVGGISITEEAVEFSILIYGRLVLMLAAFSVFVMTTSLDKLEALLFKLRLPYFFVLTLSFTFRFIPTMVTEAERIREAQLARGLDLKKGGFLRQRWNAWVPLILPLMVSTLRKSIRFAEALEARGAFTYRKRTSVLRLDLHANDVTVASASLALLSIGIFFMRILPVI